MKIDREVNVKNVIRFYNSLKSELESEDEILLDFTDTVRIDSAAAQVIISALNKAVELNKSINFTGVSPEMQVLLKLTGLEI